MATILLYSFQFKLSLQLKLFFLLQAHWICILIQICRKLPSWPQNCLLKAKNMASFKQIPHFAIVFLRLKTLNQIMEASIQSAISFITNAKIILIQPVLQAIIAFFLLFYFSTTRSTSADNSTKFKLNTIILLFLLEMNLWPFSGKILENLPLLENFFFQIKVIRVDQIH